jgi:hypothetical protein
LPTRKPSAADDMSNDSNRPALLRAPCPQVSRESQFTTMLRVMLRTGKSPNVGSSSRRQSTSGTPDPTRSSLMPRCFA